MKRKLMIISIFFVVLLAVSAVSAADNATSDIASVDNDINETAISTDNSISIEDNNKVGTTEENELNASPGTFSELQAEINNAPAASVLKLTRDYNGEEDAIVKLNKDLTIDGQGHTINCLGDDCSAFYSTIGTITLKNLKIINGYNDDNYKGGAIHIEHSAQYTIENCTFENNWADDYGGAIYHASDKPLRIKNCQFNNNEVDDEAGGAIYSLGELYIENSIFKNNLADNYGGAIYYAGTDHLKITNCQFENNKADDDDGGAIYFSYETVIRLELMNSIFTGNSAFDNGGAVYVSTEQEDHNDMIYINNCTFEKNSAGTYGGAIYDEQGETYVYDSIFKNNTVGEKGGAAYLSHLDVYNSIFDSNIAKGATSSSDGGATYTRFGTDVYNCRFVNNFAENNGGAIYASRVQVQSYSYFENNEAYKGKGGAIWGNSFLERIEGGVFIGNKAGRGTVSGDGGAIYINNEYWDNILITKCIFINNSCSDEGGAIYADTAYDHLTIKYNVFVGNTAKDKGQSVYNCGEYDAIEYNWHGTNTPDFTDQFKEWHSGSSDTDHIPSKYARICLKINDTDYYERNPYELTLYYYPVKDGSPQPNETIKDIPFTEIFFSGDAEFSNPDNHKEHIKNVTFTKNNATIYAKLDEETLSLNFNVKNKTPTSVNITSCESIYYPETLKVEYEISRYNDAIYEIRDNSGKLIVNGNITNPHELSVEGLDAGQYVITIINPETRYYLPSNASASFSVTKILFANVIVDNVTYGNPTTIMLRSTVDGKYNISINDSVVEMEVVNGTCTKQIILNAGNYTTKTTFIDPEYETHINDKSFTVSKADVALRIVVDDCTYTEIVNGTVFANVDGSYTVKIKNKTTTIDVKNNVGEFDAGTFDAGIYTATVIFDGDANHNANTNTTTFAVIKPVDFKINANTTDAVYGDSIKVTPTFDEEVNGTIKYSIDGNVFCDVGVDESVILSNLDAGSHEILAEYSGDEIHEKANATLKINITKATNNVKINAKDVTYGMASIIEITADADGTYHVDINGNEIEVTVLNNKGNASINLDAGTYHTSTHFNNKNYESQITEADFKVNKTDITLRANIEDNVYGEEIKGRIYTSADGTYTLTIRNYKTRIVVKDGIGLINETLLLDAGDYEAAISFAGDNNHNPALSMTTFHINKADPELYVIALDTAYPNDVYGAVATDFNDIVKIYLNNEFKLNVDIDDVFVIFNLGILNIGKYNITAVFDGNKNYNPVTNSTTFKVTEGNISFTINTTAPSSIYKDTVVITHTLTEGATGTIKYYLYNGTVLGEADVSENFTLPVLDCGEYIIVANYSGDPNYPSAISMLELKIEKAPNTVLVNVDDTTYGKDALITVTADANGKYLVDIAGATYDINVNNGHGSRYLSLDAGNYSTKTKFVSDNYKSEITEANFEVKKANNNITIVAADSTYGSPYSFYIACDFDGEYRANINNNPVKITVKDGIGYYEAGIIDAGKYNVSINYPGDKNINPYNASASFTIFKGDVNVSISAVDVTYPGDVVVTIKSDVSDNYSLFIGTSSPQYIILEAGIASDIIFDGLNAGTYEITVALPESDNYNAVRKSTNATVAKANVTLSITSYDVTYPNDIVVTLSSDVSGNYSLFIGTASPQYIILEAGIASDIIFDGLNAGTYEFTVALPESDNYNAARKSTNATVAKANVTMSISADDVTYPDDLVLTLLSDVSGNYSLQLGTTTPQQVVLEAGIAKNITFSGLDAGTYKFSLAYFESDNYNIARETVNVTVNKVENTTISVEATSPAAGENATVTVTLPADATGTVDVKYGNGVYSTSVVDGIAVVSVPTALSGTETAGVTYSGDANYNPVSTEVNITVKDNGVIIAENIKRGVNSSYDYYATLVNTEGKPISDVEITFTIEGKTYKAKTNTSGIATVSAGLEVVDGKDTVYNVTVTNPYTLENTTATTTIVPRLIVISGNLTADYLENPPYIVQAIGDDGNPVGANVTVRIVFAGFYYDLKTNETGHVVRTIALAPGSYAVRGEYMGYKTEQTPFKVLQILKASSGTLKKTAKTYTLKATLKHTNGKAIAGAVVKLNFNGKTYKVKTNSKGVASYTIKSSVIKKLKAGKTYILKALYVNDWTRGQWQGKIKVKK